MEKLIIGMGLPGAGKSTTLSTFAAKYGHTYVSFDRIREKLGLTRAQSSTQQVFDDIGALMVENYKAGKTVVLDGTFLNEARIKFIEFARANKIKKIQGIFLDTPEELAWERVQARKAEEKTTRELFDGRVRHLKDFPPGISDGFDSFFVLNENGELVSAERPKEQRREFRPRRRVSSVSVESNSESVNIF